MKSALGKGKQSRAALRRPMSNGPERTSADLAAGEGEGSSRPLRSYRELKVWTRAMDLAVLVYELARRMPKEEQYRVTSQMLRAAASVPANIAEGYQRGSRRDYANFVSIARGSLAELETFLILAGRADLIATDAATPALELAEELSRMLRSLRQNLISPKGTADSA